MPDEADIARAAAAAAVVEEIEPGTTIGLGSGRAVWRVIEEIAARGAEGAARAPGGAPLRAVVASELTRARAIEAGIEVVELDGRTSPALAIDGADEIDSRLGLIKGGGGALLREKIVIAAAERFVVVAETRKQVARLGETFRLPVEIVGFGRAETIRKIAAILPGGKLRTTESSAPFVTDEGHLIVDCPLGDGTDAAALAEVLARMPGVVEHGLFLGMAERAYLGAADGTVTVVAAGGAVTAVPPG